MSACLPTWPHGPQWVEVPLLSSGYKESGNTSDFRRIPGPLVDTEQKSFEINSNLAAGVSTLNKGNSKFVFFFILHFYIDFCHVFRRFSFEGKLSRKSLGF